MAVIMIRQIKTPWKRFGFYAWCCTIHWYAHSWATYFYLAILLTDLDITYDWKKWLSSRPFVSYPLVAFAAAVAFFSLSLDMMTQYTNINYAQVENGWHPDVGSGLFISQTPNYLYPQYFVPVSLLFLRLLLTRFDTTALFISYLLEAEIFTLTSTL
jgi:hypothetical protein